MCGYMAAPHSWVRENDETSEKPDFGVVSILGAWREAELLRVPLIYFGPCHASTQIAGHPSDYSKSILLRHVLIRNGQRIDNRVRPRHSATNFSEPRLDVLWCGGR